MTNGYRYGAESLTMVPMMLVRLQLVPFIVELTVMEASPAMAVNAAGIKLSKLSIGLSVLFWNKLFRIEATVDVASVDVVVGAAVDVGVDENTDMIEERVDVVSVFSADDSKESFTSPGNCCSLAIKEDSEEAAWARVSGVAST